MDSGFRRNDEHQNNEQLGRLPVYRRSSWIPAFAGMTDYFWRFVRVLVRSVCGRLFALALINRTF